MGCPPRSHYGASSRRLQRCPNGTIVLARIWPKVPVGNNLVQGRLLMRIGVLTAGGDAPGLKRGDSRAWHDGLSRRHEFIGIATLGRLAVTIRVESSSRGTHRHRRPRRHPARHGPLQPRRPQGWPRTGPRALGEHLDALVAIGATAPAHLELARRARCPRHWRAQTLDNDLWARTTALA